MSSPSKPEAPEEAVQITGLQPDPNPTLPAPIPDGAHFTVSTLPSAAGEFLHELNLSTNGSAPGGTDQNATKSQSPAEQARAAASSRTGSDVSVPGYEILGELGRGGMGVVYKARQIALNRIVALKTIRGNRVGPRDLARFLIEAEAVAAIEHPNVVRVYEYGDHEGQPYMALEFLPGGTLRDRMNVTGKLQPHEAARLLAPIARGVAAAHALGIVHRDLKPENVLFSKDDSANEKTAPDSGSTPAASTPKVADFGLAKRGSSDLTQTQAVMGTPAYMAPQQADGKTKFVGPTADVWSLGVILYECLHGERPFDAPDVHGLLGMIRSAEVPAFDSQSRIPRELDLICRKCLEKSPADRYPTAAEFADDVDRFTRGEPVTVRPLGAVSRGVRWARRNPGIAGLLSVVLLSSVGLLLSLFAQYKQAVSQAEFERNAKIEAETLQLAAEKLAKDNEELASSETARRREAERLKQQADAEASRANQVSDFMTGLFRGSDPLDFFGSDILPQSWEKQRTKTADDLLKEAAEKFRTGLQSQPLTRAKLMEAVANSLTSFGDYKAAEPMFREALELRRKNLPEDHPDVIENELALGRMYWNMGDFPEALIWFRGALAKQRRSGAPETAILASRFYEALALTFIDDKHADAIFREVIENRERLLGPNHKDTISARIGYAGMLLDQGRTGELMTVLPKVLASLQSHPSAQFRKVGEFVSAFQTGVGLAHLADSTPALADSFRRQAESKLREALTKGERDLPVDHWMVGMIRFELAGVLAEMGKDAEADLLYIRLLEGIRRMYGFAHPKLLIVGHVLGDRWAHSTNTARRADARKLWEEIDAANKNQFGESNHWRGNLLLHRVNLESKHGSITAAQKYAEQGLELVRAGKVSKSKAVCQAMLVAGKTFARPGLSPRGREVAIELLATTRRYVNDVFGPKSREMCIALRVEGEELFRMGDRVNGAARLSEAEPLLHLINESADDEERHDLLVGLGKSENGSGHFAQAEKHYSQALTITLRNNWRTSYRLADSWGVVIARLGQRKYAEVMPVLANLRKWNVAENIGEQELFWIDLGIAVTRFAAGEDEEYRKQVEEMLKRAEKSTNVNVLARTAWGIGISPKADPAKAASLAKPLATRLAALPQFAWGHWSLALLWLRAGDIEKAEAALKAGGPTFSTPPREWSFYPIIQGLCSAKRGDLVAARDHLRKAEELITGEKPSEKNPFAYSDTIWADRFMADLLLEELRATITPREISPLPREAK